jgi:hypothetical protein
MPSNSGQSSSVSILGGRLYLVDLGLSRGECGIGLKLGKLALLASSTSLTLAASAAVLSGRILSRSAGDPGGGILINGV